MRNPEKAMRIRYLPQEKCIIIFTLGKVGVKAIKDLLRLENSTC